MGIDCKQYSNKSWRVNITSYDNIQKISLSFTTPNDLNHFVTFRFFNRLNKTINYIKWHSIKDKLNILTHNQRFFGEYLNNITGFKNREGGACEVSSEFAKIGSKSLKICGSCDIAHIVSDNYIRKTFLFL